MLKGSHRAREFELVPCFRLMGTRRQGHPLAAFAAFAAVSTFTALVSSVVAFAQAAKAIASGEVLTEQVSKSSADDLPLPKRKEIWGIDRALMLELIAFMRFNLNFRLQNNRQPWTRSWVYPFLRESGTSLSFSNSITDIVQRADGYYDPARISELARKRGLECAVTGNTIGGLWRQPPSWFRTA
jgi:hypothetical protein